MAGPLAVDVVRACEVLGGPAPRLGAEPPVVALGALRSARLGGTAALGPGRGPPVALRQRAIRRAPAHHQRTSGLVNRVKVFLNAFWVCRGGKAANKEAFMADVPSDRVEQLALFRYRVISEAASPRLSPAERSGRARKLAARIWVTPDGTERQLSRTSIDRCSPPTPRGAWLALPQCPWLTGAGPGQPPVAGGAARLRRAVPACSAPRIVDIIGPGAGSISTPYQAHRLSCWSVIALGPAEPLLDTDPLFDVGVVTVLGDTTPK